MTKKLNPLIKSERKLGRELKKEERQALAIGKSIISRKRFSRFLHVLGPGLVTGAADDDPSGIATYLQAGAGFGLGLLLGFLGLTRILVGGGAFGGLLRELLIGRLAVDRLLI